MNKELRAQANDLLRYGEILADASWSDEYISCKSERYRIVKKDKNVYFIVQTNGNYTKVEQWI